MRNWIWIVLVALVTMPLHVGAAVITTPEGWTITSNLPANNLYKFVNTSTSQNLCSSPCFLLRHINGTGDADGVTTYYDEADATCDSNEITIVDGSAQSSISYGAKTVNGLCMKTENLDVGNVTVVYFQ